MKQKTNKNDPQKVRNKYKTRPNPSTTTTTQKRGGKGEGDGKGDVAAGKGWGRGGLEWHTDTRTHSLSPSLSAHTYWHWHTNTLHTHQVTHTHTLTPPHQYSAAAHSDGRYDTQTLHLKPNEAGWGKNGHARSPLTLSPVHLSIIQLHIYIRCPQTVQQFKITCQPSLDPNRGCTQPVSAQVKGQVDVASIVIGWIRK